MFVNYLLKTSSKITSVLCFNQTVVFKSYCSTVDFYCLCVIFLIVVVKNTFGC